MTSSRNLGELLDAFVEGTPGVRHAIAISADGLLVASTRALTADWRDQLAATGHGLVTLLRGAAAFFCGGAVIASISRLEGGLMLSMAFADGSSLLVAASADCDVRQVSYEVAELANRIDEELDPHARVLHPTHAPTCGPEVPVADPDGDPALSASAHHQREHPEQAESSQDYSEHARA